MRARLRRTWRRTLILAVLLTLPFVPSVTAQAPSPISVMSAERADAFAAAAAQHLNYLPGEVVIKFKSGVTTAGQQRALLALRSRPSVTDLEWTAGVARYRDASQPDATVLAGQLGSQPEVEFAQPNYIRQPTRATFVPNDPDFNAQGWNFNAADIPRAWQLATTPGGSSSIIVAVVDTGVTAVTPQNMPVMTWNGTAIVSTTVAVGPSPDLDFSRLVKPADFTVSLTAPPSFVVDTDSHGTHVASTIGETTNNGFGLAGIAFNARIMPVKVCSSYWDVQFARSASGVHGFAPMNSGGCSDTAIAAGIEYAADNGAKVINISLGGPGNDPLLLNALTYAVGKGVFIAAAMGNDFQDGDGVSFPAGFARQLDGFVSVAATGPGNVHADYSTTGPQCELSAPGGNFDQGGNAALVYQITLLASDSDQTRGVIFPRFDRYAEEGFQGTSMATPHVSASAALVLSQIPTLTPSALEHLLEATSLDLGSPGRDDTYGFGLVQAGAALRGQGIVR